MMDRQKIVVFEGDGIGPEIMAAGLDVLAAVTQGTDFTYETEFLPFGGQAIDQVGEPLPNNTINQAKRADAILLSAIGGPKWNACPKRPEDGLLVLRSELGLFANVRPTVVADSQIDQSPLKAEIVRGTDFVIVRELTSGAYFGEPRSKTFDQAIDTMYYSRSEIERIMVYGFDLAQSRRQHVTVVDKSNVLATSKLWREVGQAVAQRYPEVTVDYRYVDATAMAIVADPTQFDVLITPNLFGDILSDEAAQITGTIGQIPSLSAGSTGPKMYEPIHGSAPDIAGQGIANPISMIKTVSLMLSQSFHQEKLAKQIDEAVELTIRRGQVTPDMGGTLTTKEVTEQVMNAMQEGVFS
ncbi:3-isopropylmalate dehydrogenase [Fructobacillus tropaeoli]|uniref:3-isopropylmalate dehydrogenase n=1 Tax=Fructobacillus tropaeoli TaxID=709323 RepID=UPI002DAF163E|nr:Isocitrate/isopropylmalate dehydrogenase (LeuB) [Fructobacillus tropaeoli]